MTACPFGEGSNQHWFAPFKKPLASVVTTGFIMVLRKEETCDERKGGIPMSTTRHIEIFSAGCQVCKDTITLVKRLACSSCEVTVLDMKDQAVSSRARQLGIRTVPTVVIEGQLAECCAGSGPSESALRAAGIGTPLQ
jgi:glutaredoxin